MTATNPIHRMRSVADLLIRERNFGDAFTIYDELYRQIWSVFGTVQANLGPCTTRGWFAEPEANSLCARMYGVTLSSALEEFTRILYGHLLCLSASPASGGFISRDTVLSEFAVLYHLILQPSRWRKLTPVFALVTATVDRDNRFRRIRPNLCRSALETLLVESVQKNREGEWSGLNAILLEYLTATGEQGEFVRKIGRIVGPCGSRSHHRHHYSGRYEDSDRSRRYAGSAEGRPFDPTTATDEEKRAYYGRLFGLQGTVTKSEIRSRYISSVALYHPDKVQHLGPELKTLAEQKTKEFNVAYQWLKERYGI